MKCLHISELNGLGFRRSDVAFRSLSFIK